MRTDPRADPRTDASRREREKTVVNRALMSAGLGKLGDPGMVRQLGFLVKQVIKTHEQFRSLLGKCEPQERHHMYEAMKPYLDGLPGGAKPLDVYVAENMLEAEIRQLPTIGPGGELLPFRIPEVRTAPDDELQAKTPEKTGELAVAQAIIDAEYARVHLALVCKRCTREDVFHAIRKEDAVERARDAGWLYDASSKFEVCPKCAEAL
jgi:hypothetical protein